MCFFPGVQGGLASAAPAEPREEAAGRVSEETERTGPGPATAVCSRVKQRFIFVFCLLLAFFLDWYPFTQSLNLTHNFTAFLEGMKSRIVKVVQSNSDNNVAFRKMFKNKLIKTNSDLRLELL